MRLRYSLLIISLTYSMTLLHSKEIKKKKVQRKVSSIELKFEKKTRPINKNNYDRSFIAFSNEISIKKSLSLGSESDQEYVKKLFHKLLVKADSLAREDFYHPELNVYSKYYAFLLSSIMVPYHESKLSHFLIREKKHCYLTNDLIGEYGKTGITPVTYLKNALEQKDLSSSKSRSYNAWLKKGSGTSIAEYLTKNMNTFFKSSNLPKSIFPRCNQFSTPMIKQLLFSNDYADVGILMFNSASHQEIFESRGIFNLDKVIDYGLVYLYSGHNNSGGFKEIALNSQKYWCLNKLDENDPKYLSRLIRGVWAGQYNSGNTKETCRFLKSDHKYVANDRGYFENYKRLTDENEPDGSLWHQYLPKDSLEEKAFKELLRNVFEGRNNTKYLSKILSIPYQVEANEKIKISLRPSIDFKESEETHYTITGVQVNIRDLSKERNGCGNTGLLSLENGKQVVVVGQDKNYYIIRSNEIKNALYAECLDMKYVTIHKDYLKKVGNKGKSIKEKLYLSSAQIPRLDPSQIARLSSDIIGPGEVEVIEVVENDESETWYAYIDLSGEMKWIYAGENNELVKKVKSENDE